MAAEVEREHGARGIGQIRGAADLVDRGRAAELADSERPTGRHLTIVADLDLAAGGAAIVAGFDPVAGPATPAGVTAEGEILARRIDQEHSVPARAHLLAERDTGLDLAVAILELPVAAALLGAGAIVARGDVGTGERRERVDDRPALGSAGEIATVEQQIGVVVERLAPLVDLVGGGAEGVGIESSVAEREAAVGAVRDDVHGIEILQARERLAYLVDAVAIFLEDHHVHGAVRSAGVGEIADELRVVRRAGVDEDDLLARGAGGRDGSRVTGIRCLDGGDDRSGGVLRLRSRQCRIEREPREIRGEKQPLLELFHECSASLGIR
ncbi:MAG: hypothetical protein R3286_00510 [Gammaproteobacteria bacterium]|nr:hypothetical protein [Gammaproteobacteria bacterium]